MPRAKKIPAGPACGHSACSQNFIDTGNATCVIVPAVETVNGSVWITTPHDNYSMDAEQVRMFIDALRAAIPNETNEDGEPLCKYCGCVADIDERGLLYVCVREDCDGFSRTVATVAEFEAAR